MVEDLLTMEWKNICSDWQLFTYRYRHMGIILRFDLVCIVRPKLYLTHTITQGHMQTFRNSLHGEQSWGRIGSLTFKNCSFHSDSLSLSLPVSGYKCINTHQTLRSSLTQLFCYCRASAKNNGLVKSLALMSPSLTLLNRSAYITHKVTLRCS